MNLLDDIITYVRRIIKSPSNAEVSNDLIVDYINRFWIMDVDARLQLFDLKTKYQFQTTPGVDQYNMPLYTLQNQLVGGPTVSSYAVYQGFMGPAYINGVNVSFQTQKKAFFDSFPNIVQNLQVVGTGDGTPGPYTLQLPILPQTVPPNPPFQGILRGHVDLNGITVLNGVYPYQDPPLRSAAQIAAQNQFIQAVPTTSVLSAVYFTSIGTNGANIIVADSGQFLESNQNYGLLMQPGNARNGNLELGDGVLPIAYSTTQNTINYFTGVANVMFPSAIPSGADINAQCYYFQSGLPRAILYYNNTLTLRCPPAQQYLVELDAYLTPAAFVSTVQSIPFAYMSEYIARGAARKILSDTGDIDQFMFYEPLFKEQELLVWKRSQRQWTATRTETLYSSGNNQFGNSNNSFGGTTI